MAARILHDSVKKPVLRSTAMSSRPEAPVRTGRLTPTAQESALLGVRLLAASSLSCGRKVGVEPVGDAPGLVDQFFRTVGRTIGRQFFGTVVCSGVLAEPCR